jgi:small multidrug resistance pump
MTLIGAYSVLFAAIALGVAGTSALFASQHLTRPGSSALAVACYGGSLVLISITFLTIPMGIVYAVWSGIGMVLIVAVGWIAFGL